MGLEGDVRHGIQSRARLVEATTRRPYGSVEGSETEPSGEGKETGGLKGKQTRGKEQMR